MLVNAATDKVFQDTHDSQIAEQDHSCQENLLENAYEAPSSTLPTIFSLAAGKVKKAEEESFEDVVASCRAQMDNPIPEDQYPPIAYAVKLRRHDVVKFLIDEGESVNAVTSALPIHGEVAHHGSSPLEIAIKQQDEEMVKILTTYHPENRAIPEITYQRVENLFFNKNNGLYHSPDYPYFKSEVSSPLLDALKTGNQAIIDLVIKAYTDPKRLHTDFKAVQDAKNPSAMRSWIEQNLFLYSGEKPQVSDAVVKLFMNKKDLTGSYADVQTLLQFGWLVTSQEFEQVLIANDPQIVQLLLDHPRMEENPFFLLATHNRADLVMYLIKKGDKPLPEHLNTAVTHGSLDCVRTMTEHGVTSKEALALAVNGKRWHVARYLASASKDFYGLVAFCRSQSNEITRHRYPPIAIAVELGRHDIVKFFINHGESVNDATPDVPVTWYNLATYFSQVGSQQGYSPLELAIRWQDEEMVKILLENGANPEISHRRFATVWAYADDFRTFDANGGAKYGTGFPDGRAFDENGHIRYFDPTKNLLDARPFDADGNLRYYEEPSSLLLDALKFGNQEIIDRVLKAYTSPEKLYEACTAFQSSKKPDAMRSWIEQNVFLWKGKHVHVSDAVVTLFMENRQGLPMNPSEVALLLQHGWLVTSQEFEKVLIANQPEIEWLLVDHSRLQESPFTLLLQYDRAELVTHMIKKGTLPTSEHLEIAIKHGALSVVKALLATGMAFDGTLLFATQLKQKAIIEHLLSLPIAAKEIEKACEAAYDLRAYDILELLESQK